jgi:hypothetical protein
MLSAGAGGAEKLLELGSLVFPATNVGAPTILVPSLVAGKKSKKKKKKPNLDLPSGLSVDSGYEQLTAAIDVSSFSVLKEFSTLRLFPNAPNVLPLLSHVGAGLRCVSRVVCRRTARVGRGGGHPHTSASILPLASGPGEFTFPGGTCTYPATASTAGRAGVASFARTVSMRCRGSEAAANLTALLAAPGGVWGEGRAPVGGLGQRRPGGAGLLCLLRSVRREGQAPVSSPVPVAIQVQFYILADVDPALDQASYTEILRHDGDGQSTTDAPIVLFLKVYEPSISGTTTPELQILSDVEWITKQLVLSVAERYFELIDIPRVGNIYSAHNSCFSIEDATCPVVACFNMLVTEAVVDVRNVASILATESADGIHDEDNLISVHRRLVVASEMLRSSPSELGRLFYSTLEALEKETIVDSNSVMFRNVLDKVIGGIQMDLLSKEEGGREGLIACLKLPAMLLKVNRSTNTTASQTCNAMDNIFSPPQDAPDAVAGIVLAAYLGKLMSMCLTDDPTRRI